MAIRLACLLLSTGRVVCAKIDKPMRKVHLRANWQNPPTNRKPAPRMWALCDNVSAAIGPITAPRGACVLGACSRAAPDPKNGVNFGVDCSAQKKNWAGREDAIVRDRGRTSVCVSE